MPNSRDRRAFVRSALAASVLLPGGMGALVRAALAREPAQQGVRKLRGEVLVNGRRASPGSAVAPGDTVATGAGAYATFVVGQDAFLIRGRSEVKLGGADRLVNLVRI